MTSDRDPVVSPGKDRPSDPLVPGWKELARRMVEQLDGEDAQVLAAMAEVPRHRFVPPRWRSQAYQDTPLPVGPNATISAPHMVALQLGYARLAPGLKVLEVGSGSGYLLAVIERLVRPGGQVFGLEIEPELAARSRATLSEVGEGLARVRQVEGSQGWAEVSPFDRVLVSFAVQGPLPAAWGEQTAQGGYLLAPWGSGGALHLERWRKVDGVLVRDRHGPPCLFVSGKTAPTVDGSTS